MKEIYYLYPPVDPADILVGPEAAELDLLPGNFITPFAYELRSFPGLVFGWSRKTESYRFVCYSEPAKEKLFSLFSSRLEEKGAMLVKGRQ